MATLTPNYGFILPAVNSATDEDLWGDEINQNWSDIDTDLKAVSDAVTATVAVPLGGVIDYAGSTAPTNFALCYGQAINRTTYATLFAIIGTTYGVGDGSTTFNVPDLRGRIAAGKDDMGGSAASRLTATTITGGALTLGNSGGEETHALTTAELASHSHAGLNAGFLTQKNVGGSWFTGSAGGVSYETQASTATSGSGTAHNNVQPALILNKIIRIT